MEQSTIQKQTLFTEIEHIETGTPIKYKKEKNYIKTSFKFKF